MRIANPYRPGFNQAPLVLAGREPVLGGAAEAIETAALDGRTPRPLILTGPRGLGKTVTLAEIADMAVERHSFVVVHVEATRGRSLVDELITRLKDARLMLDGQDPASIRAGRTRVTKSRLGARVLGIEASVERTPHDEHPDLVATLARTMHAAMSRPPGAGVIITLDEVQSAPPHELDLIASAIQETVPENWPLVVAMAALPSLQTNRGPRQLPTYLERAEWHRLGDLDPDAAREALLGPANQAGRPMTDRACSALLRQTGGYPYAIQLAGHHAWRQSIGSDSITESNAMAAIPHLDAELSMMFSGRWDDASPKEREYLRAVALTSTDQAPTGGAVAATLLVRASEVSYLRDRLLKKGTLYATPDGGLHFITPGMASWIRATHSSD